MVTRLDTYVVPLINETFGEEFTDHAQVVLRNNKHVIRRTDRLWPEETPMRLLNFMRCRTKEFTRSTSSNVKRGTTG